MRKILIMSMSVLALSLAGCDSKSSKDSGSNIHEKPDAQDNSENQDNTEQKNNTPDGQVKPGETTGDLSQITITNHPHEPFINVAGSVISYKIMNIKPNMNGEICIIMDGTETCSDTSSSNIKFHKPTESETDGYIVVPVSMVKNLKNKNILFKHKAGKESSSLTLNTSDYQFKDSTRTYSFVGKDSFTKNSLSETETIKVKISSVKASTYDQNNKNKSYINDLDFDDSINDMFMIGANEEFYRVKNDKKTIAKGIEGIIEVEKKALNTDYISKGIDVRKGEVKLNLQFSKGDSTVVNIKNENIHEIPIENINKKIHHKSNYVIKKFDTTKYNDFISRCYYYSNCKFQHGGLTGAQGKYIGFETHALFDYIIGLDNKNIFIELQEVDLTNEKLYRPVVLKENTKEVEEIILQENAEKTFTLEVAKDKVYKYQFQNLNFIETEVPTVNITSVLSSQSDGVTFSSNCNENICNIAISSNKPLAKNNGLKLLIKSNAETIDEYEISTAKIEISAPKLKSESLYNIAIISGIKDSQNIECDNKDNNCSNLYINQNRVNNEIFIAKNINVENSKIYTLNIIEDKNKVGTLELNFSDVKFQGQILEKNFIIKDYFTRANINGPITGKAAIEITINDINTKTVVVRDLFQKYNNMNLASIKVNTITPFILLNDDYTEDKGVVTNPNKTFKITSHTCRLRTDTTGSDQGCAIELQNNNGKDNTLHLKSFGPNYFTQTLIY